MDHYDPTTMDLWRAARLGNVERVAELLNSGEDPSQLDEKGHPPAYYAELYGHEELATYIRSSNLTRLKTPERGGLPTPIPSPSGSRASSALKSPFRSPLRSPLRTSSGFDSIMSVTDDERRSREAMLLERRRAKQLKKKGLPVALKYQPEPIPIATPSSAALRAQPHPMSIPSPRIERGKAINRKLKRLEAQYYRTFQESAGDRFVKKRGAKMAFKFSRAEKRQLREWFEFIDADGSGEIDLEELEDPLLSTGIARNHQDLVELIERVDTDGSGEIGFDEFLDILRPQKGSLAEHRKLIKAAREKHMEALRAQREGREVRSEAQPDKPSKPARGTRALRDDTRIDTGAAFQSLTVKLNDESNPLSLPLLVTQQRREFLLKAIMGAPLEERAFNERATIIEAKAKAEGDTLALLNLQREDQARQMRKEEMTERLRALQGVVKRNQKRAALDRRASVMSAIVPLPLPAGRASIMHTMGNMLGGAGTGGPIRTAPKRRQSISKTAALLEGLVLRRKAAPNVGVEMSEEDALELVNMRRRASLSAAPKGSASLSDAEDEGREESSRYGSASRRSSKSYLSSPSRDAPSVAEKGFKTEVTGLRIKRELKLLNSGSGMQFVPSQDRRKELVEAAFDPSAPLRPKHRRGHVGPIPLVRGLFAVPPPDGPAGDGDKSTLLEKATRDAKKPVESVELESPTVPDLASPKRITTLPGKRSRKGSVNATMKHLHLAT